MRKDYSQSRKGQPKSGPAVEMKSDAALDPADAVNEVTAAQAAALTGLSERTIRRKIVSGKLPARRLMANRFAIQVRDLPTHPQIAALDNRLDALERRMQLLERAMVQMLAGRATLSLVSLPPGDGDAEPTLQTVLTLQTLLIQASQEIARLAPMVGPQEADASQEPMQETTDPPGECREPNDRAPARVRPDS